MAELPTTLKLDTRGKTLVVTLSRPESLNAFTPLMAQELIDTFDQASDNDNIRAIIVTGEGRAFCAGMDLNPNGNPFGLDESLSPTLEDMQQGRTEGLADLGGLVSLAIFRCKKPVIAAINGAAVGVGATMTLPMDFRLATSNARFGFVFSRLGITSEACSSWFLPRLVGIQQSLEWLYSGKLLNAEEVLAAGLLQRIVSPENLLSSALELAESISDGTSAVSVALIRQMVYRNMGQPDPITAHHTESLAVHYTSQRDGREGIEAFKEKRPPKFTDAVSEMPEFFQKEKTQD